MLHHLLIYTKPLKINDEKAYISYSHSYLNTYNITFELRKEHI